MVSANSLSKLKCIPCEGGIDPMTRAEFEKYLIQVDGWRVVDDQKLTKDFKFKNFTLAMDFINQIARIAEKEDHHPDILLHSYNHVTLTLSTHAIRGLSINDFILAFRIDSLVS